MEKTIFKTFGNFLSVKSASTTSYFYAERKGVDSVAFILIDADIDNMYGLINERKPAMDHRVGEKVMMETAFGGSNDLIEDSYLRMDENEAIENMRKLVQLETKEESGYSVPLDRINYVSKELVSTQMNQFCFMFIVDITGITIGERHPQNEEEAISSVTWKTSDEIRSTNDWKSKTILFNLNVT